MTLPTPAQELISAPLDRDIQASPLSRSSAPFRFPNFDFPFIAAIRGRVGDRVFKTYRDKIVVTRVPRFEGYAPSPAQRITRDRMREATAYAQRIYADPTTKALYVAAARKLGRQPFRLAISDYLVRSPASQSRFQQAQHLLAATSQTSHASPAPPAKLAAGEVFPRHAQPNAPSLSLSRLFFPVSALFCPRHAGSSLAQLGARGTPPSTACVRRVVRARQILLSRTPCPLARRGATTGSPPRCAAPTTTPSVSKPQTASYATAVRVLWGWMALCKHGVAVALAWLAAAKTASPDKSRIVNFNDVEPWLLQQEKSTLAAWLLEAAKHDGRLRERLLRQAARATNKRVDFAAYRNAIDRATPSGDFITYKEARGFTQNIREAAIEPLHELLREDRASEVIELAEYALGRVENVIETVDDSDGYFGDILDELQDLHFEACRAARPDPEELAARLFDWELNGHWEVFYGAAETYAEILGEKGLAAFRARAEAEWKTLPSLQPGAREEDSSKRSPLTHIMETLARTSGDLEGLVAIKAKDLSHAYAFLEIAELYRNAKRFDDALAWAERGMKVFPKDTDRRLLEFLAAEYHRRSRHDDAMAVAWRQFESRANLENFQHLKSHADLASADAWPSWRERALALLRAKIESAQSRARRPAFWSADAADRSTLVEIFLWEKNPDAAWREAQAGECHGDLMLRLAALREKTHPADALPIYLRHAESLIAQKNNRAYEGAAQHLKKVKALHLALDRPAEWAGLRARLWTEHKAKRNFIALVANL